MHRQRFALGSGRCRLRRLRFGNGFGLIELGRLVAGLFDATAFDFFLRPFKLRDRFVQLFGTTTELHTPQLGDNELEVFNLGLLRANQCFE